VQEIETSVINATSCAKLDFTGKQVGRLPLMRQQIVMPRTCPSLTVKRSFRNMTLHFLVPTQVKLAIACCFFLAALVSFTRERLQLSSFPSFDRASGVTFFKFFFQKMPDKRVGTRRKLSPPPTFNVDNQVIFALFVGKKRDIFQH